MNQTTSITPGMFAGDPSGLHSAVLPGRYNAEAQVQMWLTLYRYWESHLQVSPPDVASHKQEPAVAPHETISYDDSLFVVVGNTATWNIPAEMEKLRNTPDDRQVAAPQTKKFACLYPGCNNTYASTDGVRKHARKQHGDWVKNKLPNDYCRPCTQNIWV